MRNVILPLVLLAGVPAVVAAQTADQAPARANKAPATLRVKSSAFDNNSAIPVEYTCDGAGMAPPLTWSKAPARTKSLAILVTDPDAPRGEFTHWLITGLSPRTTGITGGDLPQGAVAQLNDAGKGGYAPPCPPSGMHHYHFRVYALDMTLPMTMTRADLEIQMRGHVLASGELVGTYEKRAAR